MTTPWRQIPWAGVDGVRAWTAGDLALVNQAPAADAPGADKSGPIVFWLMCTVSGRTVDTATIDVWVKPTAAASWIQVIDNGVFQGSWTGSITGVGTQDEIVSITPPSDFGSEAAVSVRVVADVDGGGGYAIDETYSFTIEDYQAPRVDSAIGWLPTKVRVTFDEDMGPSAETAAHYSLSAYQADRRAVVIPTVTGVTNLLSTVYELETDWETTPGAEYTVTVAGDVEDDAGNGVDPSHDSAQFTAYDYRDLGRVYGGWSVYQQLAAYDRRRDKSGDLERLCSLIQNGVDLALYHADNLGDLTNPDWCTAEYLEALLFDVGNPLPFVDTDQLKRRVAWRAKALNKKRGSNPGIVLAVKVVTGLDCEAVHDRDRRWRLGYRERDVEAAVNELYLRYEAHRVLLGGVHGAEDTVNVVSPSLYPASGQAQTVALLNAVLAAQEAHRILTAGGVHGAADTTNVIYRAASTDWDSAAELSGEVRRKYNAHIILTAGGVHGAEDTVNESERRAGDYLNFDTLLGGGDAMAYSFWVKFDQALTDAQRALVAKCAAAMRTAHTHYLGTLEP